MSGTARCLSLGIVFASFISASLVAISYVASVSAAPTTEQRNEVKSLRSEVRKASNYIKQGKVLESAEVVKSIQKRLDRLKDANEAELASDLKDLYESLTVSHGLLELEGFTLDPLGGAPEGAMMVPGQPTLLPPPEVNPTTNTVPLTFPDANLSFTKHIAPILIAKCGRCHVNGSRGGFSAANYATLIKGVPNVGVVIFPGDANGSRIIEVIESGAMPPSGNKVTPNQLAALKTWISEGAKFDGTDPNQNITQVAPNVEEERPPRLEVVEAMGNESVSFSRDIAGTLASTCVRCHNANTDRGNLSMENFAQLLRGGDSGAPLRVGNPKDSLLVKKLKGDGVERMPPNGPPVPADVIAKVEKWIAEGAKFDGQTEDVSMQRNFQYGMAKIASHEELAKMRLESSLQKWKLGFPSADVNQAETDNLLVIGDMGEAALGEYAQDSEKVIDRVKTMLKAPSGKPLIKGRMTLYLLSKRYEYAEFGKMVERRDLPASWRGHWWFDVTDSYAAVVIPEKDSESSFEGLLAQQLAGSYVAAQGNRVPNWFSEGAARVIASRIAPKDPRVVQWDADLSNAVLSMTKPDDFMRNGLAAEENGIVSYGFMKVLMGRSRTFESILTSLNKGMPFDQAFAGAVGAAPKDAAAAWVNSGG